MPAGRFAPSPTGLPHFGTLLAAVASFLHARHTGARWLLRIEDPDPDRAMPGAADAMLRTLEVLGLEWDGAPLYQSQRTEAYRAALDQLKRQNHVFPCACSRREVAEAKHGVEGPVYPGTCRNGLAPGRSARSYRLRVNDLPITITDLVQGPVTQSLARDVGDFVLLRGDGCFAYQLAVVVDDAFQHVTQVVRGADLLHSTPRQVFLQRQLGLPTPEYLHIPIVLDATGKKLSKSEGAPAVDPDHPASLLYLALVVLGQQPAIELREAPPRELLRWARQQWRADLIPRQKTFPPP
ncbi:MAG: tRNA glutamyl-Q(34) synthetase GluQRS [Burkholderiales bacterium]